MEDLKAFIQSFRVDGIEGLTEQYKVYDTLFSDIHRETGYGCIKGCGACCHTPSRNIEVSVFEMIPMAIHIFEEGKAEDLYHTLEQMDLQQSVCIIFQSTTKSGDYGYCQRHPVRPLICRLFAGGTQLDKNGNKQLVVCRQLKEHYASNPELMDDLKHKFPVINEFSYITRDYNPALSSPLVPINEGLKLALEFLLIRFDYFKGSKVNEGATD